VHPAAGLVRYAFHRDTPVIEVNPQPTDYSPRVVWVQAKAGEALPAMLG
jgi:hypothetical protein